MVAKIPLFIGLFLLLLALTGCVLSQDNMEEYMQVRHATMDKERNQSLGWNLELTHEEAMFNEAYTILKAKELGESFETAQFSPAVNFLHSKTDYEKSEVFKLLKSMPKGGLLHIHEITMTSIDWVISNVTYRDNLYYRQETDHVQFQFTLTPDAMWTSVAEMRVQQGNQKFDTWLREQFTMQLGDRFSTVNDVWKDFMRCLESVSGLIFYLPVFKDYFREAMREMLDDGVIYLEFRTTLPPVYEMDGTILSQEEVVGVYHDISNEFKASHPMWCGTRLIFAPVRSVGPETVEADLELADRLLRLYPDFVVGFDLVAQEDLGRPLIDFIEPLLKWGDKVKYIFHAGETNWDWASTDLNLLDSILLNTTRIGHGYALIKHPELIQMARDKDIAVEINPISNQVLGLVSDLRNHPAASLVKSDFPLVVSSDDPPAWNALPLSHDLYAAVMAIGGQMGDIRFVKQLGINSIRYSSLGPADKSICLATFHTRWMDFIQEQYVLPSISVIV